MKKVIRFLWIMLWYIIIAPVVLVVGTLRIAYKLCEGYELSYAFRSTMRGLVSSHRINMLFVRFGRKPSPKDFES